VPIDFTTTALIASIKTRSQMPSVQELFTDAEICTTAGEVLRSVVIPQILKRNEDFFVTSSDQALVAGTRAYRAASAERLWKTQGRRRRGRGGCRV
jgi:hypothetical protein